MKHKKILEYCIPVLIPLLILIVIFAIKGVYPFGTNLPGYIDYNEGLVPAYTSLWDVLHGKANIFIDWNLGAGANMFASMIINTFLSPISWLIALFPREQIAFCITYLIWIKVMLMSLTAYLCFKKLFKNTNHFMLLLFSVSWAFSGWFFIHYTNIGWLDVMILLPLFILAAKKLIDGGKIWQFVLILTTMLLFSYYISYMLLVGIVISAIVYLSIFRKDRKEIATKLFAGIMISLVLSAILFLPSLLSSLGAHRFANTTESGLFEQFNSKTVMLVFSSLLIYYFVKLICKFKQDKKNVLCFLLCFLIINIGIIIEPINEMWHTGSYFCFPFRYGFISVFILILGSLYYINKFVAKKEFVEERNKNVVAFQCLSGAPSNLAIDSKGAVLIENGVGQTVNLQKIELDNCKAAETKIEDLNDKMKTKNNKKLTIRPEKIFTILACVFVTVLFCIMGFIIASLGTGEHPYRAIGFFIFLIYLLFCLCGVILLFFIDKIEKNKTIKNILIASVCFVQIFCFGLKFFGVAFGEQPYNSSIDQITNVYNIKTDKLVKPYKIKDAEGLYMANFPLIINYPSLSTWIHISSEEQYQAHSSLGYSTISTMLLSDGGTAFSDMLLSNRYVMTGSPLSDKLYNKIDNWEFKKDGIISNIELYEYKYYLPVAIEYADNFNYISDNAFLNQNNIYKNMFKKENDIINIVSAKQIVEKDKDGYFTLSLNANGTQVLYMLSADYAAKSVIINEKEKLVNDGIFELGVYENQTFQFKVKCEDLSKLQFGAINVDNLKQLADEVDDNVVNYQISSNALNFTINNTDNRKYAFLPVTYLKGYDYIVNGKEIKQGTAISNYVSVQLEDGVNEISIVFTPPYLKIGLIISMAGLVVFVAFLLLNKKFKLLSKKPIVYSGYFCGIALAAVVVFLVYIKPLVRFFVKLF